MINSDEGCKLTRQRALYYYASIAFLLDNGIAYHVAHLVGILEHVLEYAYLPADLRKYKHLGAVVLGGEVIVASA